MQFQLKNLILIDVIAAQIYRLAIDQVLEVFKFLCAQGDALAHSCVVGAPFTDVILGSIVVPAYKVELLCPAFSILSFLLLVDFI